MSLLINKPKDCKYTWLIVYYDTLGRLGNQIFYNNRPKPDEALLTSFYEHQKETKNLKNSVILSIIKISK
jgi:hypothetical protein